MDAAKLHLLLNYYPVIGMGTGTLILIAAFWFRSKKVKSIVMRLFIAIAIFTFPVFVTGEMAGSTGGTYTRVTAESLNAHKSLARLAFALVELTGLVSFAGLILLKRNGMAGTRVVAAAFVLSIITSVLIVCTAHAGRQVKWAAQLKSSAGAAPQQIRS